MACQKHTHFHYFVEADLLGKIAGAVSEEN